MRLCTPPDPPSSDQCDGCAAAVASAVGRVQGRVQAAAAAAAAVAAAHEIERLEKRGP